MWGKSAVAEKQNGHALPGIAEGQMVGQPSEAELANLHATLRTQRAALCKQELLALLAKHHCTLVQWAILSQDGDKQVRVPLADLLKVGIAVDVAALEMPPQSAG